MTAALVFMILVAAVGAAAPTGYPMHAARVVASRPVCANGRSRLLRLSRPEGADWLPYRPGHVLALELADGNGVARRGPYTVSRADADEGWLEIIYRVIDPLLPPPKGGAGHAATCAAERKSSLMASAIPGDAASLGGRFHTPILEGFDLTGCAAVFLISSGVGVGPQAGFVRECFVDGAWALPPVRLFAGYREEGDVALQAELDALAIAAGTDPAGRRRFAWAACLTADTGAADTEGAADTGARLFGRTTNVAPPQIAKALVELDVPLSACHFHVIGRGSLVSEWKSGLKKAGISNTRVTDETYFGHSEPWAEEAAAEIARGLLN
ncbi:hypothetical protein T492DRAFT_901830 [Pavlovales sp. CCMP2436]|nr:hypothetical protein T492DRAFT_901830 [Pavlovales sp. CCMP2436]